MNPKLLFLKEAIENKAPMDKEWVFRASAVIKSKRHSLEDYYPYVSEEGTWIYYRKDEDDPVTIGPCKADEPLFSRDEAITLTPEVLPMIKEKEVTTTFGVLLLNLLILWYPFGEKSNYHNGGWNPKMVDGLWKDLILEGEVTLDQILLSSAGASQTTAFNTLFTPSYTERTTRVCPAAMKRLKELLKERKDELSDPAAVAEILEEVYQLDKAWIEADVDGGKGFLIADKAYRVVRMHLLYTHILNNKEGDIATPALRDGLVLDKFPAAINESMKGSLDRGFNTALGGVAVKEILRLLALVSVKEDDCKTNVHLRIVLTKDDVGTLEGRYIKKGNGLLRLTKENFKEYLNKEVLLRDPSTCKSKAFCGICVGDNLAENSEGIKGQGIEWGSVMVGLFMAAMHGKSLVTEDYDIETSIC